MPLGPWGSILSEKVVLIFYPFFSFLALPQGLYVFLSMVLFIVWDENSHLSLLTSIFGLFSFLRRALLVGGDGQGLPWLQGPPGRGCSVALAVSRRAGGSEWSPGKPRPSTALWAAGLSAVHSPHLVPAALGRSFHLLC